MRQMCINSAFKHSLFSAFDLQTDILFLEECCLFVEKRSLLNKEILFLLQNRLPLLYCSTITENWFNCTAVSTKLLLLLWSFYCHQCFFCIAVPMKFLLLLWSFYCFNNVPAALQFILQSDCQYRFQNSLEIDNT